MRKPQLISLTFLVSGFIVFAVPTLVLRRAIAQPQPTWRSVFGDWFRQEPKDPGSGRNSGGRPGDALCLITPVDKAQVWTTQPLFVWQGGDRETGIRLKGNLSIPWEDAGSVKNQANKRLNYVSQTLTPGKEYEWGLFIDSNRRTPIEFITFQVIGGAQRDAIAKELQALESRLKAQNANEEAIALERTNYFIKQGLRADALQEIYSVKHPSAELKQVMQDIEKKVCQSQE